MAHQRIGFFVNFGITGYSGGRIHALLMAEALSYSGHTVEMFCNVKPSFYNEFTDYNGYERLIWHVCPDLNFSVPEYNFDWIVCVPHRGFGWNNYDFYLLAAGFALKSRAKTIFLSFESDSMVNTLSPFKRTPKEWQHWYRFSKYADIVMSSTICGNRFAARDYKTFMGKPNFEFCYPSINSIKARKYINLPKKKQIIVFNRWSDPHKNSGGIVKILSSELVGYEIKIVVGSGVIPSSFMAELKAKCEKYGITYRILNKLNEDEKFKVIAQSKALVFLSGFEGFGLPPVEAQYCGVPCVCFDLPVLREVNGDGVSFVEYGDYEGIKTALIDTISMSAEDYKELHDNIAEVAEFEQYAKRLESILKKHHGTRSECLRRWYQKARYAGECAIVFLLRPFLPPPARTAVDINTALLESYIKLQWKLLAHELPSKRVAVFGSEDYLLWLNKVTGGDKSLDVTGLVENKAQDDDLKLWGKPLVTASEFDVDKVDAIILATECFQKKYKTHCEKLYGSKVQTIDLYEGLSPGPYPKGV